MDEIESIDSYDFRRARLSVALKWILNAAYGADIPAELEEPLPLREKDTISAIYVNTGIVSLLVNGSLYGKACCKLFPELADCWTGDVRHWSVIQGLSRLGIYVLDDSGQSITEKELTQTDPLNLTAHVGLIESIVRAYIQSTATIHNIVKAVKAIGPFNASDDLPYDSEDALLLWINKVCAACIKRQAGELENHQQSFKHSTTVKVSKKLLSTVELPNIVTMEDILKDACDGCNLAVLISFYCPSMLSFFDIHLKEPVGIADSLYNLSLINQFCDQHLPVKTYHFNPEDILYTAETIKPYLLAFITQLFQYFAVNPLDIVDTKQDYISPVKSAIGQSNMKMVREADPVELISNVTKQSFQKSQNSKLKNVGEHYGSNPSLDTSLSNSQLYGKHALLPKRSPLTASNNNDLKGSMHDVLSPIVVRKSRSMVALNAPDPSQSLVAWDTKSYFVNRVKKSGSHSSAGSNLLANVSMDTDKDARSLNQSIDLSELSMNSSVQSIQRKTQSAAKQRSEPSTSYQKLLERSNDLNTPLKQFALKHGYSLHQVEDETKNDSSSADNEASTLTQVTPRSDLSPRTHSSREPTSMALSYVITSDTEANAVQAGISAADSQSISFTSIINSNGNVEDDNEPIAPITLITASTPKPSSLTLDKVNENTLEEEAAKSPITSFADIRMEKLGRQGTRQSSDFDNDTAASPGLRNHYMRQLADKRNEEKPTKKTTFAVNMTTWQDTVKPSSQDCDSDTASETSEISGEKQQSSDVRILLEEKRKAMEKKKSVADMERTRELNNCSRDAFLKAVSKRSMNGHQVASNDKTLFSRTNITNSIENLQNKWVKDEESNAKRTAATTAGKRMSTCSLDHIAEINELDTAINKAKLSPPTSNKSERRASKDYEQPVDVEQFGLEKLNESLSELKGEMERLTTEQKHIEQRQVAIITMAVSAPSSLEIQPNITQEKVACSSSQNSMLMTDNFETQRGDSGNDLEDFNNTFEIEAGQELATSSPLRDVQSNFTKPSPVNSTSQSTESSFVLHNSRSKSVKKGQTSKAKSTPRKSSSQPASTPNSGGFLSSSQLSKKTLSSQSNEPSISQSASMDLADGRKRWVSQGATPLFPGYDDDTLLKPSPREPVLVTGTPAAFQPPVEDTPMREQLKSKPSRRPIHRPDSMQLGNMVPIENSNTSMHSEASFAISPTDETSVKPSTRLKVAKDSTELTTLHGDITQKSSTLAQLHYLPTDVDTPLRDAVKSEPGCDYTYMSAKQEIDTPMRQQNFTAPEMDTPMRVASQQYQPINQQCTEFATSSRDPHPLATSRHGVRMVQSDVNSKNDYHTDTPQRDTGKTYQLCTPYGTADNVIPATNLSLSSVMDNIRNDFVKRDAELTSPTQSQTSMPAYPSHAITNAQHNVNNTVSDLATQHSATSGATSEQNAFYIPFSSEAADNHGPLSSGNSSHNNDSDDRASTASGDSGSSKPKRATWDMSTPRGDVLNTNIAPDKAGIGFVIAAGQLSEDELTKRKERVMMMQLKRREENERKKNQKEAEAAAKKESQRQKEELIERRKAEEKVRKESILLEYQLKRAEEDLPPEMRATFRQKQAKKERMQWSAGAGDDLFNSADNGDVSSSFTVMSGSLTHRRPSSPTSALSTSRSKASSRGTIDIPNEEYSGPKLYVKPSEKSKSNRTIIINAISHCCLAGVVNVDNKNKVLEGLAKSDGKHFLILFRDGNQTYKAVYSYNPDSSECARVHGQGPKTITNDMCHRFYKYNSGGKNFTEVLSTKHLSVSIDAITIQNHLWAKRTAHKK